MNNDDKFSYTYSAPNETQRREIESIRKQYTDAPEKDGKLEKLRRLNRRVTRPPFIIGLTAGIIGTLILGVGMAMALEWNIMVWGAVVGLLGIIVAASAYPLYRAVLNRNKKKYAREIIDLSNELLNEK